MTDKFSSMRDIKAHTGLRGIAAVAVFFGHAEFDRLWPNQPLLSMFYSFFYWQNPAVDLFFMLSGFILNYVYLKQRRVDWRDFFAARFARICPLYYAGLLAIVAMNLVSVHMGHPPDINLNGPTILKNVAMVQEWSVFGFAGSINIPSWSISVEMFLYIVVFPILCYLLAHRRLRPWMYITGLILAIFADGLFCQDNPFHSLLLHSGIVRGIAGFSAGYLICELVHGSERLSFPFIVEAIVLLLALALMPMMHFHFLLPAVFAALMALTYMPDSRLGALLGSPPLSYLGVLSYSIYIWQYPVLRACSLAFGIRQMGSRGRDPNASEWHELVYCVCTPLVLLGIANISYYGFESPLRRLFRRPFRDWFRFQAVNL